MVPVEHAPTSAGAKPLTIKDLWESLKSILFLKHVKEKEQKERQKKAEKKYEERMEEESEKKIEEARKKHEAEEAQWAYHKRGSGAKKAEDDQDAYQLLREADQKREALDHFNKAKSPTTQSDAKTYDSVAYLFQNDLIMNTPGVIPGLTELIEQNADAARIMTQLTTGDRNFHSNSQELVRMGSFLLSIAQRYGPGVQNAVSVFNRVLAQRVKQTLENTIEATRLEAQRQGRREPPKNPAWLFTDMSMIPAGQRGNLQSEDPAVWRSAIDTALTVVQPQEDTSWMDQVQSDAKITASPTNVKPPQQLVDKISDVLNDIKRREQAGQPYSSSELQDKADAIDKISYQEFPSDVIAGSQNYINTAKAIREYSERVKDKLAQQAEERVRKEAPIMKRDLTPDDFLKIYRPAYLGQLLEQNPEIRKLLVGDSKASARLRNRLFLKIHASVLSQRRESFHENFGLYERADFTTFLNLVRSEMSGKRRMETGTSVGQTWIDWYVGLSNSIRLTRDIDFYASQPGIDPENFGRSISFYQNEYNAQMMSIPGVEQAFRAYLASIRAIKSYNDGYIPPGMVEYHSGRLTSEWDNMAYEYLKKMISMGVVKDVERDDFQFHKSDKNGLVKLSSTEALKWNEVDEEEMFMYLTLGKGFGLSTWMLLDEFSFSKAPGGRTTEYGMPGFHSIAYEGIARAGNFLGIVLDKFRYGWHKYFYFMNLVLPAGRKHKKWTLDEAKKAYISYRNGTFAKEYGEDAKRLVDQSNFSHWSANLPYSSFRHTDTTLGWSDKNRENLGASSQIILASRWAGEKVKDFLVAGKYREEFRRRKKAQGQLSSGPGFDKLWQSEGIAIYKAKIENEWDKIEHARHVEELVGKYTKAFKARVWIEAAMRNPLVVGHNIKVKVPIAGYTMKEGEKEMKLHSLILQNILGIPFEDMKYGEIAGSSTSVYATPTEQQLAYMREAQDLESDLIAVRERAIQKNEELTEDDFKIIKDDVRKAHALEYWKIARQVILGSEKEDEYRNLYQQLGLELSDNKQDYHVNWHQIEAIDTTLNLWGKHKGAELSNIHGKKVPVAYQLTEKFLKKDWEHLFSADDISIRDMDMINLGSRHLVRRAGDAMAHFAGGQRLGKYINEEITANPNPEDLAKALHEVTLAYAGDDATLGWRNAAMWVYLTGRFYAWDWTKLASPAQREIWKTRRGVAGWDANARRKFLDAVEHMDVLPPEPEIYMDTASVNPHSSIEEMRKDLKATNKDVLTEIITLGILIALAVTVWRALTAKSEEEEGGGGGGHR